MIPRYYQQAANDAAWNYLRNQSGNPLIVLPTGCHSAGHPILMANGSIKSVESVGVGDQLMGPDSKPRTVLRLCRGRDQMFLIKPIRGKAFLVNGDHVLHLECTNEGKGKYPSQKIGGEVDHITVREYLGKSKSWKHLRKLRQSDTVDFGQSVEFRIPPYIAGLMLGDGHMNKSISLTNMDQQAHDEFAEWVRSRGWDLTITTKPGNKAWTASIKTNERGKTSSAKTLFAEEGLLGKVLQFKSVPDKYLTASRLDRLELIAGLLDSDGYHDGKGGYEFSNRSEQLCNSLAFLCRSVGLRVTEKVTRKRSQLSDLRIYFRIHISGDTDQIPCRIPRNKAPSRRQIKNHLRFGFTVEPAYIDNFYGFTLSDDHLYLDGNFLIHHNSGKSLVISMLCRQALAYDARVMVLQHRKELIEQNAEKIQILMPDVKVGLNSAGLKRHAFDEPVICAGIQTVYRKAHEFGRRELIIVDEAHLINHSNDDSMYSQFIADIRSVNPTARVVGLTATPMRTGEGPICGKNKLFQKICYEAFTGDLIQQGYLCPITNKPADATVDTSGIQTRGGEFVQSSMDRAFDVDDKVKAACIEILTRCQDRHSILVFASGVHHAESIADCLRQLTGDRVGVVTGETIDLERRQYLTDFKNLRLRWMVNCDVLSTGYDAPCIDAIAVLRATMSPGLFAQIVGRGLRKHESKSNCVILDFGENIKRHGSLDDPNYGRSSAARSAGKSSKAAEQNGRGKPCPNCELDVAANSRECPECGFLFPANHDSRPDEDSTLTGQAPPEEFVIESVGWARHQKRDPDALPTVRIDYAVQPAAVLQETIDIECKYKCGSSFSILRENGPHIEAVCSGCSRHQKFVPKSEAYVSQAGNLSRKHISEWVCFEHEGFALRKAHEWWQLRSDADVPTSVDEALYFLDRKMARHPVRLTARQEGKWWRIVSVEFDTEKPSEEKWLGEMELDGEFESSELEDVPF